RDQDLRLDLQEPRGGPGSGGEDRRSAARGGGLRGPRGRRRPVLPQALQLRREPGRGEHRRRAPADGRGQAAGRGGGRGRARARGAAARGGEMARRLGSLRRPLLLGGGALALVLVVYLLFFSGDEATPRLTSQLPTATIGSGKGVVVVAADGTILH